MHTFFIPSSSAMWSTCNAATWRAVAALCCQACCKCPCNSLHCRHKHTHCCDGAMEQTHLRLFCCASFQLQRIGTPLLRRLVHKVHAHIGLVVHCMCRQQAAWHPISCEGINTECRCSAGDVGTCKAHLYSFFLLAIMVNKYMRCRMGPIEPPPHRSAVLQSHLCATGTTAMCSLKCGQVLTH